MFKPKLVINNDGKALGKQLAKSDHSISNGAVAKLSGVPIEEITDQSDKVSLSYIHEFIDAMVMAQKAFKNISRIKHSDYPDAKKVNLMYSQAALTARELEKVSKGKGASDVKSRRIKELENAMGAIQQHLKATEQFCDYKGIDLPGCFGAATTTAEHAMSDRRKVQKDILGE